MFTSQPSTSELRQGDIIQGIYCPVIESSKISLLGTPIKHDSERLQVSKTSKSKKDWLTAQMPVFYGFSIIVSQCCDLALRDGKLMIPSFVIAPLVDVPYQIQTNQGNFEKLKKNNLGDYVNLFYIPATSPLISEKVADFTHLMSLPKSEYDHALSSKVLQLEDKERIKLKLKIAHTFGRPTQEEIDAGLYE